MATNRAQTFREFQKHLQEEKELETKDLYKEYKKLSLIQAINKWANWKEHIIGHDHDTVSNNRRKLLQLLKEYLEIDYDEITLKGFINMYGGAKGLHKELSELQQHLVRRAKDLSIPEHDRLKRNTVYSLFSGVN